MHFSYVLLAIIYHLSIAFGICYNNGRQGSYRRNQDVLDLRDICRQLSGKFDRLEVRRLCPTDKIGVSWSFELKMIGSGLTREISIEECMDGMTKELMCKADRGGRYKVKPNYRDLCFDPPYWKPLGAHDEQDEPRYYQCHHKLNVWWACWNDEWSLP
ncbi:hypothetical protein LZ30DRAFT_750750 [Colletotrichum cereale]|nr:hypothetical protein LZ30DRAFT_750750 [Colletotrichum cereale]